MTMHAVRHMGKMGILVEAGEHGNPENSDKAYEVVLRGLSSLGMIEPAASATIALPRYHVVAQAEIKSRQGRFLRPLENFMCVTKGMKLAQYDDGSIVKAEVTGKLYMVNECTPLGEDWFLILEEKKIDREHSNVMNHKL